MLKSSLAALAFLTWFPYTKLRERSQQDISHSRIYFPLVGLLLGLGLVVVERGASLVFAPPLTAALVVVLLLVVTVLASVFKRENFKPLPGGACLALGLWLAWLYGPMILI